MVRWYVSFSWRSATRSVVAGVRFFTQCAPVFVLVVARRGHRRSGSRDRFVDFWSKSALFLQLLFCISGGLLLPLQLFEFSLAVHLIHMGLLPTCTFGASAFSLRPRSISRAICAVGCPILADLICLFVGASVDLGFKRALLYSPFFSFLVALFLALFVLELTVHVKFFVDLLFYASS